MGFLMMANAMHRVAQEHGSLLCRPGFECYARLPSRRNMQSIMLYRSCAAYQDLVAHCGPESGHSERANPVRIPRSVSSRTTAIHEVCYKFHSTLSTRRAIATAQRTHTSWCPFSCIWTHMISQAAAARGCCVIAPLIGRRRLHQDSTAGGMIALSMATSFVCGRPLRTALPETALAAGSVLCWLASTRNTTMVRRKLEGRTFYYRSRFSRLRIRPLGRPRELGVRLAKMPYAVATRRSGSIKPTVEHYSGAGAYPMGYCRTGTACGFTATPNLCSCDTRGRI
ncbi:hypothetical protein C8Q73DRAFT_109475 [Cubamyces lactineus]|nr:hypothetical protein C8Q73DRAFT_109475 [Cubamyces lactineus]